VFPHDEETIEQAAADVAATLLKRCAFRGLAVLVAIIHLWIVSTRGLCEREDMTVAKNGRRKCKAHKKDGSPCGRWPIRGATVCHTHGGAAPQVKLAAARRLALLVDPALDVMTRLLGKASSAKHPDTAARVARDVLDRTGNKQADQLDVLSMGGLVDLDKIGEFSNEEIAVAKRVLMKAAGRSLPPGHA